MPIFDSTKEEKLPSTFEVSGIRVVCPHCRHEQFEHRSILLNTPGMTFFGLDWANRTAAILICTTCGQIQWFAAEPQRVPEVSMQ